MSKDIDRYVVYVLINAINYKMYVGISKNFGQRWGVHKYAAKGSGPQYPINRAMRKYGIENFNIVFVETFNVNKTLLSKKEQEIEYEKLKQLEIYYIRLFGTMHKKIGYNIREGGQGSFRTEEEKLGLSARSKKQVGEKNPFFGKKHSEHSKELMAIATKKNRDAGVFIESDIAKRKFTIEQENIIAQEYANSDLTIKNLMKKYNCGSSAIYRIIDTHNVHKVVLVQNRTKPNVIRAVELHNQGLHYEEIAEIIGVSRSTAHKYLTRAKKIGLL